ncbi:MAG: dockerin type I repeat-containing protein [Acutalibacteraceae bacterium]
MKKTKILVSCLLAAVLAASLVTPAFAVDEITLKLQELEKYCGYCAAEYAVNGGNEPGNIALEYTNVSRENLSAVLNEADDFLMEHYYSVPPKSTTPKEIQQEYDKVAAAEEQMCFEKRELEFLINFCSSEKNSDNYYDESLWDNFTGNLENANKIMKAEEYTPAEMKEAYWGLLKAYNLLCLQNNTMGDVNSDGKVSNKDILLVQKHLAKITTLNSSQKLLAVVNIRNSTEEGTVKTEDVLVMQSYLAKVTSELNSSHFSDIEENLDTTKWRSNPLFHNAMRARYEWHLW